MKTIKLILSLLALLVSLNTWGQFVVDYNGRVMAQPFNSSCGDYLARFNGAVWIGQLYTDIPTGIDSASPTRDLLPINNATRQLYALHPYAYRDSTSVHYALSPKQLKAIFPNMVKDLKDGKSGVNYMELIPVLVKCINELQDEIANLKKQLDEMRSQKK